MLIHTDRIISLNSQKLRQPSLSLSAKASIARTSDSMTFYPKFSNIFFISSKPILSWPSLRNKLNIFLIQSSEQLSAASSLCRNAINQSSSTSPPPSASISLIISSASEASISISQAFKTLIIQSLETPPELSMSNSLNIFRKSSFDRCIFFFDYPLIYRILLFKSGILIYVQGYLIIGCYMSNFKIRKKSNSLPKQTWFQKQAPSQLNHYRCLKQISNTEQFWKSLLQNQLEMASTIVAFQNVQISMRVDAHKKLLLRETFVLKKQIIRLIINEKEQEILSKLQILRIKSPADHGLVTLFTSFYQIRKTIIERKLEYKKETCNQIRKKIIETNEKIEREKFSILYGRIVYIAALHLVKLDGVLIRNEDISIVVQALNLKKKELCIVSSQINQITLQSLLFLTFQFYKILYMLKRDQDLMTQYYNQIRAYISIFQSKCHGYEQFQKNFKISEKIEKMRPLNYDLKIYDDHSRRKILSLENTQSQLMKNHYSLRNGNILCTEIKAEIQNKRLIMSSHFNPAQSSIDNTQHEQNKTKDQQRESKQLITSTAQKMDPTLTWDSYIQERFCFDFFKPDQANVLKGSFKATLNQSKTEFEISIKLNKLEQIIGMFKLGWIQLQKRKNLGDYARKLWRIVKQKFYVDKNEFLPNLFSFQYPPHTDLPKRVNFQYQLPISVRIHQILLHYLRKNKKKRKINGTIIEFPKNNTEKEEKKESNQEDKIFAKRHGFISFNKESRSRTRKKYENIQKDMQEFDYTPSKELKINIIIKQQLHYAMLYIQVKNNRIVNFSIIVQNSSKQKNEKEQKQYKEYCMKIIDLFQNLTYSSKVIRFIDYFITNQSANQYFFQFYPHPSSNSFDYHNKFINRSIQEQFQVMKSPVLEIKHNIIKIYKYLNPGKKKFKYKQKKVDKKEQVQRIIIKIEDQYFQFCKEIYQKSIRYYDNKRQFTIINSQHGKKNTQIRYKKFRLYKSIVHQSIQQEKSNFYSKVSSLRDKFSEKGPKCVSVEQKIEVNWKKTVIFKSKGHFYHLNIFLYGHQSVASLFDVKKFKYYMGFCDQSFLLPPWSFNEESLELNNCINLKDYKTDRHLICDIQKFIEESLSQQKQDL